MAITLITCVGLNAQMSESGKLGVGLAWTSLNYGASAKYNFTETHTGQVIVGAANYGFSFSFSNLTVRTQLVVSTKI